MSARTVLGPCDSVALNRDVDGAMRWPHQHLLVAERVDELDAVEG